MSLTVEREIARYSYIMIVALITSSLFNYLYQVVMGVLLPKHEFGVLGVALSIMFIASVLTQNTFSWSGTRRLSNHLSKDIFRTVIVGNTSLALIASVAIILLSLKTSYLLPCIIVSAIVLITALNASCVSLLRAIKKFKSLAIANVIFSILKLILAIFLVLIGWGALGALLSMLIATLVVAAYLVYESLRIELDKSKGSFGMITETFLVSITFIGITFVINSSIIFMRWISGSDVLAGDYNAALTIARGPFFITAALITVLFPYVSSPNDRREFFAFQSIKYMILLVFPICLSMAVDPKTWLNLFFGQKYAEGAEILRVLSIGIGLTSLAFVISSNLIAFEKLKVPAVSLFIASMAQIAVIFLLKGDPAFVSALSVVISSAIAVILLVAYYARRFYFKCSVKYVIKIAVAYSVLSAVFLLIHINGRLLSLAEIVISFIIYFLLLSILGLFDEKDVKVIFSPLPRQSAEWLKRIVSKLNSIGR